jgi:hypothetical protein
MLTAVLAACRAAVLTSAGHMLGHSHPQSRYWAANLLQVRPSCSPATRPLLAAHKAAAVGHAIQQAV